MSQYFAPRAPTPLASDQVIAGNRLYEAGRYDEARRKFEKVLQRAPGHPQALWSLGRTLMALKQFPQSIAVLERAVAAQPDAGHLRYDLGAACLRANRVSEAITYLSAAAEFMPGSVEVWSSLGYAQYLARQYADAHASLQQALALDPVHASTINRLGLVYAAEQDFERAIEHYMRAIEMNPGMAQAWANLGTVLKSLNQLDEALVAIDHAHALDPANPVVKLNQSLVRLLKGELRKDVWLKYEYRWVVLNESPHRGFRQPLWQGTEPLAGKSLLVHAEQGLGDTLQFIRFLPQLAARGATVHLEVQPALKPLLATTAGATTVLARGEPLPMFDLQCPLLALPFALDTTLETIPHPVPYVYPPADRVASWGDRLPPPRGLRVGVVWRGNPKHVNDANRSMPFASFRRMCDTAGCEFFPLQVQMNATEAAFFAAAESCVDCTADLHDFADTAALIAHLDVVVAVDTSVAHVAAAMGKPTWIMLPYSPDWRWLMDRSDSPWYPTARLFRQRTIGDWDGVVSAVQSALHEYGARGDQRSEAGSPTLALRAPSDAADVVDLAPLEIALPQLR